MSQYGEYKTQKERLNLSFFIDFRLFFYCGKCGFKKVKSQKKQVK